MSASKIGQNSSQERHEFQFCEINAFGRAIGWDIDFRQLDAGSPRIDAQVLKGPRTTIMEFRLARAYHQRGFAPKGALNFGIPLTGPLDWHGERVSHSPVLSFNGNSGFDSVSRSGFAGLTLSTTPNMLEDTAATYGVPVPKYLVESGGGQFATPPDSVLPLANHWRRLLSARPGTHDPDYESELLLQLILTQLGNWKSEDASTSSQRARASSRAIDFIESRPGEAIRVSEVCRETGVAWRTLDRAFRERFGIGPKAYLTRRRLGGVREALAAGPTERRIADVANAWGFWHIGQLARDYRRLFGELPSETRRRGTARLA
jgi:AraC-like DNA-binding protein